MGKKIFVSYKYADRQVENLNKTTMDFLINGCTTVRHYVDKIQGLLDVNDHINKGEADGEDLSDFKDNTIISKLRDKIYDSSITIVVISKGMKDSIKNEEDQWIPWEISYSLKEHSRNDRTSRTNAVLAVVIPDENGSYDYFIDDSFCRSCNAYRLKTDGVFKIISENMHNFKNLSYSNCSRGCGNKTFTGYASYIHSVKWSNFKVDINSYINIALEINKNINNYNLVKSI